MPIICSSISEFGIKGHALDIMIRFCLVINNLVSSTGLPTLTFICCHLENFQHILG